MGQTSIEWADHSINPIKFKLAIAEAVKPVLVNMCTVCSDGCKFCYSASNTRRFWPKAAGAFPGYTAQALKLGEFVIDPTKLQEVIRRRKPTRYFWCDMTDMFHPSVPFELVDQCFAAMALTPHHTHMILTKRPERMAEYFTDLDRRRRECDCDEVEHEEFLIQNLFDNNRAGDSDDKDPIYHQSLKWLDTYNSRNLGWPLPNVWLGTSVEDQKRADERIPHLLKCPAAVRFLSCEPLLGPVDLCEVRLPDAMAVGEVWEPKINAIERYDEDRYYQAGDLAINWVICGGESGHGARPCNAEWIRSIVKQCKAADVACFVKQLGANSYVEPYDQKPGGNMPPRFYLDLNDPKGGDMSEFPRDLCIREMPGVGVKA
jgi:protein gp37